MGGVSGMRNEMGRVRGPVDEWRAGTREADEGRDMTAIYLRHFIIIREVNKEMRL